MISSLSKHGFYPSRMSAEQGYYHRMLLTFAVIIFCCCAPVLSITDIGVVTPSDPFRFIGERISLDCNITNKSVLETSSNLSFEKGNIRLSGKYIRILNTRAIRYTIPAVNLSHEAQYTCVMDTINNHVMPIGNQRLTVDYKPKPITDETCRVYNWQNMTCTWNLSVDYQHIDNVHVSVYWVTVDDQHDCPIKTRTSCTWGRGDYSHSHTYTVQVTVEYKVKGQLLDDATKRFSVETLPIVQPDPVQKLEAWSESSSCILLSWEHIGAVHHDKEVIGEYRELGKSDWIRTILAPNATVISSDKAFYRGKVCGNIGQELEPHTQYQFRVAVMPVPASPVNHGGYLSEWREVEAWTEQGVPSAAPEICPVCFFNVDNEKLGPNSARRVRVTWKDIPKIHRHGTLTFYNISYTGLTSGRYENVLNRITMEGKPLTSVDLDLPSADEDFLVKVAGGTIKGESPKSSNIIIPAINNKPPLPKRFRVERNNSKSHLRFDLFYLHWAAMMNNGADESSSISRSGRLRRRVTDMPVTSLYVVWCRGDPIHRQCKSRLDWDQISPERVTYELYTNSSQGQGHELLIGIASEAKQEDAGMSKVYSSGIDWSDCIYIANQKPQRPPLNVRFAPAEYTSGLTVLWKKLGCGEETSFVTEYLVRYCVSLRGRKCDGEIRTVNVTGDTTIAVLSKLEKGVQYRVFVEAASNAGLGPPSDSITYTVPSQPPEEDFTNLIVIIIIIVATTLSLVIIITFIRHCYRQKKKVPSIKGLLDLAPSQQPPCPPSRLDYQSRPLPDPPSDAAYEERHIYGSNSRRVCMNNHGYEKAAALPAAQSDEFSENKTSCKVPLISDQEPHQSVKTMPASSDQEAAAALLNGSLHNSSSPVIDDVPSPTSPSISSYIRYQGSSDGGTTAGGVSPWEALTGHVAPETSEDPSYLSDYCMRETLPLRHGGRGPPVPQHPVAVFHTQHGEEYASVNFPHRGPVNNFHPVHSFHHSKDSVQPFFVLGSPNVGPNIPNGLVYPTGHIVDDMQDFCTCGNDDSVSDLPDSIGNLHTSPASYMHLTLAGEPSMPQNHIRHPMPDQRNSIPIEAVLGFPPPPPGSPSPTPPYDNAPPLPAEAPSSFDYTPRPQRQPSMTDPALDSDDYLEPQALSPSLSTASPTSVNLHHINHQGCFSFPSANSTENQLSPVNGRSSRPVTTEYVPNIAVGNPGLNSPSAASQNNQATGLHYNKDPSVKVPETPYHTQPSSAPSAQPSSIPSEYLQSPDHNNPSHNCTTDMPNSSKAEPKPYIQNATHHNSLRDSGYVPNSDSPESPYTLSNHSDPDVSASSPTLAVHIIPTHNLSSNGLNILKIPSSHTRPLSTDLLDLPEAFLKDPLPPGSNEILTEL